MKIESTPANQPTTTLALATQMIALRQIGQDVTVKFDVKDSINADSVMHSLNRLEYGKGIYTRFIPNVQRSCAYIRTGEEFGTTWLYDYENRTIMLDSVGGWAERCQAE